MPRSHKKRKGKKLSDELLAKVNYEIADTPTTLNVFEEQILIIDGAKEFWDDAIFNLDRDNTAIIDQSDENMEDVQTAYQNRVDAGCKSDLVWRVVGLGSTTTQQSGGGGAGSNVTTYNCQCVATRLDPDGYPEIENQIATGGFEPGGVGFETGKFMLLDNDVTGNNPNTISALDLDSKFGLIQENRYAIKIYDQPMGQDVGDSTIMSFIGTCGAGSTQITMMLPASDNLLERIGGALYIIADKNDVFNNIGGIETAPVIGFGTALADLRKLGDGKQYVNNALVLTVNILGATAGAGASAPEPGTGGEGFVDFTLLGSIDGAQGVRENLALTLSRDQDPYQPQTISLMEGKNEYGKGFEIELVNNGHPRATQSWNPEESTEHIRIQNGGEYPEFYIETGLEIVEEPQVGGGKITYREGFDTRPESGANGNPVNEGDTFDFGNITLAPSLRGIGKTNPPYGNTSGSNCNQLTNNINSAIDVKDDYISNNLVGSDKEANTDIKTANESREERKENYEERIWSLRIAMGNATNTRDRQSVLRTDLISKKGKVDRDD